MPLVSVGDGGKDDSFREVELGVEKDFVIGLYQGQHILGDRLQLAVSGPILLQPAMDRSLNIIMRELVAQCCHHLVGKRALNAPGRRAGVRRAACRKACWEPARGAVTKRVGSSM